VINAPEFPERPVVIELFSSQSCGKCPEANRVLGGLAQRKDVIALTYPVGYWNYLGWDDTFAKPEFAERQTSYNKSMGNRGPYTPQMVYSGRLHSSGVNISGIEKGFEVRTVTPYTVAVKLEGGDAIVSGTLDKATHNGGSVEKAWVSLVHYRPGRAEVTIGAGPNKGKSMTYFNLVTRVESLGAWRGGKAATFKARCDQGCTVLVQKDGPTGEIIGVTQKK